MRWIRRMLGKSAPSLEATNIGRSGAVADDDSVDAMRAEGDDETVVGERHIPSVNRVRSLQSRLSGALAAGLVSVIGLGFLVWYYSQALTRGERAQHAAERAAQQRAQGEVDVPPLGRIEPPRVVPLDEADLPEPSVTRRVLGAPPPSPDLTRSTARSAVRYDRAPATASDPDALALERKLAGAVLVTTAMSAASEQSNRSDTRMGAETSAATSPLTYGDHTSAEQGDDLSNMLRPTVMPAAEARLLPDQHLLLGKSTSIDCTLETAIDTSLQGFAKCITATDTFSSDGTAVLVARGSRLFGETRGQVRRGNARVFVLWTEARSDGVVIPLESPGTDELGRTGLPGKVNHHFVERFGAAFLTSIVEGAVQAAVQSESEGAVVVNPSTASQVMTEVLRNTINLPPTVLKPQGDRIQVMVVRDVDFRGVYALRIRKQ